MVFILRPSNSTILIPAAARALPVVPVVSARPEPTVCALVVPVLGAELHLELGRSLGRVLLGAERLLDVQDERLTESPLRFQDTGDPGDPDHTLGKRVPILPTPRGRRAVLHVPLRVPGGDMVPALVAFDADILPTLASVENVLHAGSGAGQVLQKHTGTRRRILHDILL